MNDIINIISTIGFPAACVVGLAWFVKHQTDENTKQMEQMRKEQVEQIKITTEAITNNTLALQKLIDKLDLCRALDNE
jgi:exo-beta-1,3-glucanase (GH17 family)